MVPACSLSAVIYYRFYKVKINAQAANRNFTSQFALGKNYHPNKKQQLDWQKKMNSTVVDSDKKKTNYLPTAELKTCDHLLGSQIFYQMCYLG